MTMYAGLAADDTGGDDRPPIVLLHGLTFDRRIWQPITEQLRARDATRRVVAFDLPGHGESPEQLPHDFDHLEEILEEALRAGRIERPVVVGHSIAGGMVSTYGARHPVSEIVNVDQPPDVAPFARLLTSIADELRGPAFADVWARFHDSFHTELLADDVRALVERNSSPRRELVLSYWSALLDRPADEATEMIDRSLSAIAEASTPYTLIVGMPLAGEMARWITDRLPHAQILDWSPSGHFPHLAHADRFVELLAETGP